MAQDYLYPVQYLRAIAALAVFYFHFSVTIYGHTKPGELPIEQIGAAGVDLFFVVSGFIMAMIVWRRPVKFSRFMLDRIFRIVPLYWLTTLVVFSIAIITPTLLGSTKPDTPQLLHSLMFIPYGIGTDSSAPTLLVGWTLNYEMFFYCLIGIFAGFANDRSLILTSGFICLLVIAGIIVNPNNEYAKFYVDPIILEFPIGVLAFHCWRWTSDAGLRRLSAVSFVASLVAIVLLFDINPGQFRFFYWGVPAAILLLSSLHFITVKIEVLKLIGDWSYSIYLLHLFLIMSFHKTLIPLLSPFALPWQMLVLPVTIVLIIVSAISYICFEIPVARWLKGVRERRLSPQSP